MIVPSGGKRDLGMPRGCTLIVLLNLFRGEPTHGWWRPAAVAMIVLLARGVSVTWACLEASLWPSSFFGSKRDLGRAYSACHDRPCDSAGPRDLGVPCSRALIVLPGGRAKRSVRAGWAPLRHIAVAT